MTNKLNGFTGIYDGGNHTIGGQLWQITAGHMLGGTWHDYKGLGNSGLFGNVSSSGKIQNINIDVNVGSSGSNQYDMGIIAKELLNHEEILKFSSVYEDYIRVDTPNKFWVVNTNKLIRFYEGADGLKTGFTDDAGYCMAVTAKRDGMRIIAIVLGEDNGTVRNQETSSLLDYGFNMYKVDVVKNKNDVITEIPIEKGTKDSINAIVEDDLLVLKKKSEISKQYDIETKLNDIKLPINEGDIVGKVLVRDGNKVIKEANLIADTSVKKLGYFRTLLETLQNILTGNMI